MKQISVWPLLYPWPVYLLFYHCLTRCLGNTTTQCCVTSRHCRPSQASSRPWGGNMLCSVSKSWSSAWKPSTGRQALVNTHSKYFGCFHGITTYCKQNWNITERHVQTCPIVCKCETLIYHTLDPRLGCLWRHSDGVCRYQGFNNCLVVVGWSCHMLSFLAMHFFQLSSISLPYFTIFVDPCSGHWMSWRSTRSSMTTTSASRRHWTNTSCCKKSRSCATLSMRPRWPRKPNLVRCHAHRIENTFNNPEVCQACITFWILHRILY